ncbi:MAG TPA: hypothetical protein VGS60_10665 [Actinomycetes bacterium]|nr:hypothetical protein [Actinomycetes bacterium]
MATRAPSSATPTAPPTCRLALSAPEASPLARVRRGGLASAWFDALLGHESTLASGISSSAEVSSQ